MSDSTQTNGPRGEATANNTPVQRRGFRYWFSRLPGRRLDYFFLGLIVADILLFLLADNENIKVLLGSFSVYVALGVLIFDTACIVLWAGYLWSRAREEGQGIEYLRAHWYEVLGLVPLIYFFRFLLLLRAAKFAIAFYKLGRSEQDVSTMITRDITFRFRDIIVDTIADAVFLQSLQRVEEVMSRLDYAALAREAFNSHQAELRVVVNDAFRSKTIVGELARIPFMGPIADRLGEDASGILKDVLETATAGDIMKDIARGILKEMYEEVRKLDVERLTTPRAESPLDGKSESDAPAEPT